MKASDKLAELDNKAQYNLLTWFTFKEVVWLINLAKRQAAALRHAGRVVDDEDE